MHQIVEKTIVYQMSRRTPLTLSSAPASLRNTNTQGLRICTAKPDLSTIEHVLALAVAEAGHSVRLRAFPIQFPVEIHILGRYQTVTTNEGERREGDKKCQHFPNCVCAASTAEVSEKMYKIQTTPHRHH